ncbi:MAG: hypothetical protein IJ593_04695 [Lachnospiraceae bacterium]|nr:hypothetical protein [Lachnospiraceae bacterium]
MRIMNGDKIVARLHKINDFYPVIRGEPGVTMIERPIALFGLDGTEVTLEEFFKWIEERCFPPERVGADELLAELGLKEYNALSIVEKTKGVLSYQDNFWIDFDNN